MSPRIDLPGPIGELARVIGSVQQLANYCRVNISTVARWAHKKCVPRGPAQMVLEEYFKAWGIPSGDFFDRPAMASEPKRGHSTAVHRPATARRQSTPCKTTARKAPSKSPVRAKASKKSR